MKMTLSQMVASVRLIQSAKAFGDNVDWGKVVAAEPESVLAVADMIIPGAADMPLDQFFEQAADALPPFAMGIGDYLAKEVGPKFVPLNGLLGQALAAVTDA